MFDVKAIMKEKDFKDICGYCSCAIKKEDWETVHHTHAAYKTIKCSCGRDNQITLDPTDKTHCSWLEQEVLKKHQKKEKGRSRLEVITKNNHAIMDGAKIIG